jgi:hypothetical protein
MPGLNVQLMLATARARFSSFQLRLPAAVGGRGPEVRILGGALPSALKPGGSSMRGAPLPCPPALFLAASGDKRDLDLQLVGSEAVDSYLSRMCDAVGRAHTAWRQRAMLVKVAINGPMASGGSLTGGGLGPDTRQNAPREGPWQVSRTEAIAKGIGICWENWQLSVSVPGATWYPSFAAFPGPLAPPTPNVPMPLVALQQNPGHLSTPQLKRNMLNHYTGDNEWPGELFEAVAFGFERAFHSWAPSQMVMSVMGTGPVPGFAPPYVPVGPVIGGTGTQLAGVW